MRTYLEPSKHYLGLGLIVCCSGWALQPTAARAEGLTVNTASDASQVPSLIETLRRPGANQAVTELAKMGSPAVEPLILLLTDEKPFVRHRAAFALGLIGDNRAGLPLIEAVERAGSQERSDEAIWSIGRLRDQRGVEPLLAVLSNRTNEKLRWSRIRAAVALGEIGDQRAVDGLLAMAKEGQPYERAAAAVGLGKIRDQRAVEPLLSILDSTPAPKKKGPDAEASYELRRGCVWALGELRDSRAIPSLMQALREQESAWVPEPMANALEDDLISRWSSHWNVGAMIGLLGNGPGPALAKIGEPSFEPLLNASKDNKAFVRAAAATALGLTGSARAVEPLILLTNDKKEAVRVAAAAALAMIADKRASEWLGAAFKKNDYEVILAARHFFFRQLETGSEPVLVKALNKRGNVDIAVDFWRSGNAQLKEAAETWMKLHNFNVSLLKYISKIIDFDQELKM
jgi:HEAT repeat protein